jgi:PEP-CTERM motif
MVPCLLCLPTTGMRADAQSGAHREGTMKTAIVFVFLAAIVALPSKVLVAQNSRNIGNLSSSTAKKVKSVPEPATMLLVGGAAAGLVGVRKLLRRKR